MARIPALEPPFTPDVEAQLATMMPAGMPPIGLFRTFARNLPMTIAMAGVITFLLENRLRLVPRWILPTLVLIGLGSVLQWSWSESHGVGDLRWYVLFQALTFIVGVLLLILFPARDEPTRAAVIILVANIAAKILESLDKTIFAAGGIVSGHTLKHLAAGLGFVPLVLWLAKTSIAKPLPRISPDHRGLQADSSAARHDRK